MTRSKLILLWGLLLCTAGLTVISYGCGGGASPDASTPPAPQATQQIQHVVVIVQENRSVDHLFHDPVLMSRGADIATSGINSLGQRVPLAAIPLVSNYDRIHAHIAFLQMWDNGKMDGADNINLICNHDAPDCPPSNQFCPSGDQSHCQGLAYVQASDVQPYYQLAETYTFADRMFQSNQGPSFPAHQFILSGTSATNSSGNLLDAENPSENVTAGCIAPPDEYVRLIDPTNPNPNTNETQTAYPCFEHQTLTDLLEAKGISWRYYAVDGGSIWTAPNAIEHMCGPNQPPPNGTACNGSDWTNNVVLSYIQVLTDIANGQLAGVSWVTPSGQASDHADVTDGSGPSWVASVVNAIGSSPYWDSTAIFITWDDWGGWYDHVTPTIKNSYQYGFRVPLIVASPYAKAQYISHVPHSFGSILHFIETNFGLGSLGFDDADSDDLSDCFDFKQTPLTFTAIKARLKAKDFLEDKRPPLDPDDD